MLNRIHHFTKTLLAKEIYGFISPSVNFNTNELDCIRTLIKQPDEMIVATYEAELAAFIGTGQVITFGAGRMAFYALLKQWNIGIGDEVMLTGFTCAVMANAVLRLGATPVYVDIDPNTLGPSVDSINNLISDKTKVIVAQHSFGIPCHIDKICEIARRKKIYLVEDCALSLGSTYKGKQVGTWGDAAIFSTDHTKPLNTLIGGFVYTEVEELVETLKAFRRLCSEFKRTHVELIVNQYNIEHKIEEINHKKYVVDGYINTLLRKLNFPTKKMPYLQHESSSSYYNNNDYPYPAKLHPVLAFIGMKSLKEYKESIYIRKEWLSKLLKIINKEEIPSMYFNSNADIIPLRLAYLLKNKKREEFDFIDDCIWFKQPIVATNEALGFFGYTEGGCPMSESIGRRIMNLPIILERRKQDDFLIKIKKIYK